MCYNTLIFRAEGNHQPTLLSGSLELSLEDTPFPANSVLIGSLDLRLASSNGNFPSASGGTRQQIRLFHPMP